MKSQPTLPHQAACALRDGRWDEYVALIRQAVQNDEGHSWTQLAAEHPTTVNLFSVLPTLTTKQARAARRWFLPAIGKLNSLHLSEAIVLLNFAESLDPSYRHALSAQLQPHIAAQPSLGCQIGESLRAFSSTGAAALSAWAGAFSSSDPQEAAKYAVSLMSGSSADTRLVISLIHSLDLDAPDVQLVLAPQEEALSELFAAEAGQLGHSAWSALTDIACFSPTAVGYLLTALKDGNSQAAVAVAQSFYRLKSPSFGVTGEPLQNIVEKLLHIGLADEQARARIDDAVESLMSRDSLRPHVVACLMDLCSVDAKVVEMYRETFGGLAHHQDDFVRVLTDWLLRPDARFSSISGLLSMCAASRAPVGLDAGAFAAQSHDRRVKAARRLLALMHHGPTLCLFISIVAEMAVLGDERFSLSGQMLRLTFAEYPSATVSGKPEASLLA